VSHAASAVSSLTGPSDYYNWRQSEETVGGSVVRIVAKPGCTGFGRRDAADLVLAEAVDQDDAGDLLVLNSRTGIVGAVAAYRPRRFLALTSANFVDVEASRRTLAANAVSNAAVYHSSGLAHLPDVPLVDAVAIRLPKGRIPLLRLLRDAAGALRPGGRLYLAGANDEGIKSALERLEQLFGPSEVLAYRGGARVGVATKRGDAPWHDSELMDPALDPSFFYRFPIGLHGHQLTVCSKPGIFAWDRLDPGSRMLAEALRLERGERVVDLGSGNGVLGAAAAALGRSSNVCLVDVDIDSLDASRATQAANGLAEAEVLASDSALAVADRSFDVVVTNPPFHQGWDTGYDVARQFVRDAADILTRSGRFYLVANRFLPYEATMREAFDVVHPLVEDDRYKVLVGRKPRSSRRA
jgi:16S rRNA (guanine1207-N2)-methyltransferase